MGGVLPYGQENGQEVELRPNRPDGRPGAPQLFETGDNYPDTGGDKTEELIGQCHNIAILRLSSPESMDWASRYFGSHEWWAPSYGRSTGETSTQESRNVSIQERRNILASLFRELRPPTLSFGLEGVFATPHEAPWHGHLSPQFLRDHLSPEDKSVPGISRRPSSDQEPVPYTTGLGEALGVNLNDPPDNPPSRGFTPSLP